MVGRARVDLRFLSHANDLAFVVGGLWTRQARRSALLCCRLGIGNRIRAGEAEPDFVARTSLTGGWRDPRGNRSALTADSLFATSLEDRRITDLGDIARSSCPSQNEST